MKNHLIILISIICFSWTLDLTAQRANFSALKDKIEARFQVDLDTIDLCETIVFDGIVFEITTIDDKLKKYRLNEILITELGDLSETRLAHMNCNFMIILGTGNNQSRNDKREILEKVKINLNTNVPNLKIHDYLCSQCKQVLIEGRPYGIYEAQKILNELKVRDIKYIAKYDSADPKVYGQNATNGLVEIFLTDKKKKSW